MAENQNWQGRSPLELLMMAGTPMNLAQMAPQFVGQQMRGAQSIGISPTQAAPPSTPQMQGSVPYRPGVDGPPMQPARPPGQGLTISDLYRFLQNAGGSTPAY